MADSETQPLNRPEGEPLEIEKTSSKKRAELASYSTENINMCYLFSLLLTVSIGTVQFGYMIGSWNAASGAYGKKDGWDDDE